MPKGTLLIRAAEQLGISIPRFCDHPLLDPAGACRQCLVEVTDMGNGRGMPKPAASCTTTVMPGMVIKTQLTSVVADKAQQGVMEMLLINHPLDCPICDKGGECPLQNQAMSNGRAESRFVEKKRTFPKPIAISSNVLLDRERCVLCQRCTRFSEQIAGDPFIDLLERGPLQQIGTSDEVPFQSYFSGNTVQICPVGALTGASYRFRARPFDLQSTDSVCEHCSSGCAQRSDWRRSKVTRRMAGDDPQVNEEWNCDKGRWAFHYAEQADRLLTPDGPRRRRQPGAGELARGARRGPRRDWPRRSTTAASACFRAAGSPRKTPTPTPSSPGSRCAPTTSTRGCARCPPRSSTSLPRWSPASPPSTSPTPISNGLPRCCSPASSRRRSRRSSSCGCRSRRTRARRKVWSVAARASEGLRKLGGTLVPCRPGGEGAELDSLPRAAVGALGAAGALILVGERLASSPGALSAAASLAAETGARLAWVPRRAGERGAVDTGALPTLLPGARLVSDAAARAEVEAVWGAPVPDQPGRDVDAILAAAAEGSLPALLVGAVDPDDTADPATARRALETAGFIVSLEIRHSAVTDHADVVLPVAPVAEKAGRFVTWEGRRRPFELTIAGTGAMSDGRVLHALAEELDVELNLPTVAAARAELLQLGTAASRPAAPTVHGTEPPEPDDGEALLATWPELLDAGRMQDGDEHLAGTAKPVRARVGKRTAKKLGVASGDSIAVSTDAGALVVPVEIDTMPEGVVWLPTNARGCAVRATLGAVPGTPVRLTRPDAPPVVGLEKS